MSRLIVILSVLLVSLTLWYIAVISIAAALQRAMGV